MGSKPRRSYGAFMGPCHGAPGASDNGPWALSSPTHCGQALHTLPPGTPGREGFLTAHVREQAHDPRSHEEQQRLDCGTMLQSPVDSPTSADRPFRDLPRARGGPGFVCSHLDTLCTAHSGACPLGSTAGALGGTSDTPAPNPTQPVRQLTHFMLGPH